nr:MAG: hypothetical protein [Bacteriophage sp.]
MVGLTRYQTIDRHLEYLYLSAEGYNTFKTNKLLGKKKITIVATPTREAVKIISLREEGIIRVEADFWDAEGVRRLHIYLE